MKIRVGFEMLYDFPQPTPMIMVLGTHFTRASDIIVPDHLITNPVVPVFPSLVGYRPQEGWPALSGHSYRAGCLCGLR